MSFLAEAGLLRLGLGEQITEILDPTWMLPAVGQGALGLECRADDEAVRNLLQQLSDSATHQAVLAERAFLRGLGGGCRVPIGGTAKVTDKGLTLRGVVLVPDGSQRIEGEISGEPSQAEQLGSELASQLLTRGVKRLL